MNFKSRLGTIIFGVLIGSSLCASPAFSATSSCENQLAVARELVLKTNFDCRTEAVLGTPIRKIQSRGAWVQVQTPDGYMGWLHKKQFKSLSTSGLSKWNSSELVIVTNLHLELNGVNNAKKMFLPAGSILKKISESKNTVTVALPSGMMGTVNKEGIQDFHQWAAEKAKEIKDCGKSFGHSIYVGRKYGFGLGLLRFH